MDALHSSCADPRIPRNPRVALQQASEQHSPGNALPHHAPLDSAAFRCRKYDSSPIVDGCERVRVQFALHVLTSQFVDVLLDFVGAVTQGVGHRFHVVQQQAGAQDAS